MTKEEIIKEIQHGNKFPFDAPDAWWDSGEIKASPITHDWAHSAARGIMSNLCGRRGLILDHLEVDEDTRVEIIETMSKIIHEANGSKY